MAEKFSILDSINLYKLNKEIDEHRCTYLNDPYIFMNCQTYAEIAKCFRNPDSNKFNGFDCHPFFKCGGLISQYQGCKVFDDPTLEYGEIELR